MKPGLCSSLSFFHVNVHVSGGSCNLCMLAQMWLPQHIAKTKKKSVILARFCHGHEYAAFQAPGGCACALWFTQFCLHMAKLPGQFSHFHRLSHAFGCFSILVKFFDFCNGVVCVCVYVACNL